jgi:protein tyrosine/serine phosphatase
VALILSILGVPVDQICQEYQLTEIGMAEQRKLSIEKIMASGAFDGEDGLEAAHRMTGAKAESMKQTLDMINEKYGSAEGYVRTVCGLNDADIEGLRRNLIVKDEPIGGGVSHNTQQKKAVL